MTRDTKKNKLPEHHPTKWSAQHSLYDSLLFTSVTLNQNLGFASCGKYSTKAQLCLFVNSEGKHFLTINPYLGLCLLKYSNLPPLLLDRLYLPPQPSTQVSETQISHSADASALNLRHIFY